MTNYDASGLFLALLVGGGVLAIITVISIIAIVRRVRKKRSNSALSNDEIKKDESSSKLALLGK